MGIRKEGNSSHLYHSYTRLAKAYTLNDISEGRINCPSVLRMLICDHNGRSASTTMQKERLISLCLSVLLNWRFDVTEKESLTLFLLYGISPPFEYRKDKLLFLIRRSRLHFLTVYFLLLFSSRS